MNSQDVYHELSKKLRLGHSTVLPRIWKTICSEEEARIVDSLPATASELADRFGMAEKGMQAVLDELFHKGVVFEAVKDGVTTYRMPRNIIQFRDATILWQEVPQALLNLWIEFSEKEYPAILEFVTRIKMPSFMRVIPIGETVAPKSRVLAHEDAMQMLGSASTIAVTACICRKLMKKCDAPLETCLQINRAGEYSIKRGTGRRISMAEAIDILERSRKAGLVHMTENSAGRPNVVCNCCSCCCEMLSYATDEKTRGVISPSRYQARLDRESCTSCGLCEDICPVGAISAGDEDAVALNNELCIGCGLCASVCPSGALTLEEVRPAEFIPA